MLLCARKSSRRFSPLSSTTGSKHANYSQTALTSACTPTKINRHRRRSYSFDKTPAIRQDIWPNRKNADPSNWCQSKLRPVKSEETKNPCRRYWRDCGEADDVGSRPSKVRFRPGHDPRAVVATAETGRPRLEI